MGALRRFLTGIPPIVLSVLVAAIGPQAHSAELRFNPAIGVSEAWDSNVFTSVDNAVSDFYTTVSPRCTLSLELETSTISLTGGFDFERYSRHTELNNDFATKNLGLSASKPIRLTSRLSVRPAVQYTDARDLYRRNQFALAGEAGTSAGDTVIATNTRVRELNAGLQTSYAGSASAVYGLGGGYVRRNFSGGGPEVRDSRSVFGNLSADVRLTPLVVSGFYFDMTRDSFEGAPNAQTYTGALTASYTLSPASVLYARAGASYERQEEGPATSGGHEVTPYGRLSLSYAAQDFRATAYGSYEYSTANTTGQMTRRASGRLTARDQFAKGWFWDAGVIYVRDQPVSDTGVAGRTTDSIVGALGLQYRPTVWATFQLSGSSFRQWFRGTEGDTLRRDAAYLTMVLSRDNTLGGWWAQ